LPGYKLAPKTVNYAGIEQRWLVVQSQETRESDLRNLLKGDLLFLKTHYCLQILFSAISRFLNSLRNYSFSEKFTFQAKRYPLRYVFDFLLSTPYLWVQLSELEWIEIMNSINPRLDPLKLSLDSG
jgi:hypothetical protein